MRTLPKKIDVSLETRAVRLVNHQGEYASLTTADEVVASAEGKDLSAAPGRADPAWSDDFPRGGSRPPHLLTMGFVDT